MTTLLRNRASIAWAAFALAALWVGAWLTPPPGHWAGFPAWLTTIAGFAFGVIMAILAWRSDP